MFSLVPASSTKLRYVRCLKGTCSFCMQPVWLRVSRMRQPKLFSHFVQIECQCAEFFCHFYGLFASFHDVLHFYALQAVSKVLGHSARVLFHGACACVCGRVRTRACYVCVCVGVRARVWRAGVCMRTNPGFLPKRLRGEQRLLSACGGATLRN